MKIVAGTDFSDGATSAARAAAIVARRWDHSIVLIHAYGASECRHLPSALQDTIRANEMKALENCVSDLSATGVRVEGLALEGTPEKVLADTASNSQTRLMVLGSHGSTGEEGRLGSVVARVAEYSRVPVLVVKDAKVFEEWDQNSRPLRLFVSFDFTAVSENALSWIKHLTNSGRCEIVIGFVDCPGEESIRLGLPLPWISRRNPPILQKLLERDLNARAIQLLGDSGAKVRSEPALGRPESKLIEMAIEERADILVTGTHQRHGMRRFWQPSAASFLLRNAPMSVLTVPGGYVESITRDRAKIHRVLVAVDPGTPNRSLAPYAYALVSRGDLVRMIHVRESGYRAHHNPPVDDVGRTDAILDLEDTKHMWALVPADATESGITTELAVIHDSDVPSAICQEAERFGADVVCLGAHRHSTLTGLVMGSVSRAVADRSSRPILIVKNEAP